MKSLVAITLASVVGCASGSSGGKTANAPISPDFVAAAPRLHIDSELTASDGNARIMPSDIVAFEHDSAELSDAGYDQITRAALFLRRHSDMRVVLEGHADAPGADAYNADLSTRRIDIVRDHLLQAGVASDRIVMLTYGESEAIEPANPADRRVTMFATRLSPEAVAAVQAENREVIVANWTDRGALVELRPGTPPMRMQPTAISRR